MLRRRLQLRLVLLRYLAAGLLCAMAAVSAEAQSADVLPPTPTAQFAFEMAQATVDASPAAADQAPADPIAAQHKDEGENSQDEPVITMFPHADGARYWISGQANVIFQGRLPFHSPYQGPNSFRNSAEYKTSLLGTLYTAVRPWKSIRYQNDLILDVESSGGRGLSEALGLAGFTNLDVVRNPNLGSTPYLARYEVHQVIGLTDENTSQDSNPFALATKVPVRRIEFRVGKMTVPDFFDISPVGSDSHLQFMNWTVDDNGAWDYAADTRGYTLGGIAEYDDRAWSIRYGIFAMPVVANGIDLDWAFSRAHASNTEFELRKGLISGHDGTSRLLFYDNRAHMGNYREAVRDFLNGTDTLLYGATRPDITLHEKFGALKYGFGYNVEQDVTDNLRVFGRFGWNDGATESFAYTEVDQTVELGGDYRLDRWHRPQDKIGLAFVSNAVKRDHQNYLKSGGLGFLLGDDNLSYGRENIVEGYYNWHAWRGLYYALDVQHIDNPGYNSARGPAWVGSVRGHIDF